MLVCLAISIIACLLGASVMLKVGGGVNHVLAAIIVVAGAGFPLWIFMSTQYMVDDTDLEIISGPFSWHIPIQSITSVQETHNAATSPALSFDRLEIMYDENRSIYVSPLDKAAFIQKLGREKLVVATAKNRRKTADRISKSAAKKNDASRRNL
ncbi:MAG: PH domain-containing protein [Nitrosomonas sp.]|nr:MAG: PH domain-containing protein [Nitrosomonas sp.]